MRSNLILVAAAAAFVASPALASVGGIVDGSFETQGAAAVNGNGYCYINSGLSCANTSAATTPWTGTENAGFMQANPGWGSTPAEDGQYYGFIQTTGALSQTFTAASTGNYLLDFFATGRNGGGGYGDQTFDVLLNGSNILSGSTTTGQAWTAFTSSLFSLVGGETYTLTFQGTDMHGGDNTAFIDNVSLRAIGPQAAAVPEPATWAMMLLGFGAIGIATRRKRKALAVA